MLMFRWACLALVLSAVACAPAEEERNDSTAQSSSPNHQTFRPPPERFNRSQTSSGGSWLLSYQAAPDPIPLNQHFRLLLNVQNAQSRQPAPDTLQLQLDATMPAHNHGMNVRPELKPLGDGRYEVQGLLFHMAGYWEIAVQLQSPGAEAEVALFGVTADIKPTAR